MANKKLHYNKEALLKDYRHVFKGMMLMTGGVVLLAIAYFFIMAMYLGGTSHTKHKPYFDTFVKDGRMEGNYEGLKLPVYEQVDEEANSAYYAKKPHVKGHHTSEKH